LLFDNKIHRETPNKCRTSKVKKKESQEKRTETRTQCKEILAEIKKSSIPVAVSGEEVGTPVL
jgi:hypothetical protein